MSLLLVCTRVKRGLIQEEIRRGAGDSIESHSIENTFYRSKEIQYRRQVEGDETKEAQAQRKRPL